MAIHIDIYAHLRDRELVKDGERILQLVDYYEREANRRAVTGAQGRSKKIIAANDKHDASVDQSINKIDDFRLAVLAAGAAQARVAAIQERATDETWTATKKTEDLEQAQKDLARSMQNIIYKGQALNKAVNDETRAKADLNDENAKYTKNAKEVTRITNVNRRQLTQLSRTTNKLRRDTENLHAANITIFQDNTKVAKSMESLADLTKKAAREQEKYDEIRKKEGVTGAQIKAQGRTLADAKEAEARKARDVQQVLVELIEQRREHDSVVNQNEVSLRDLASRHLQLEKRAIDLRSANRDVIDQSVTLTRQFDRVGDSVKKVADEYREYHEMSQDASVSSDALEKKIESINKAFVAQQRAVRDSSFALDDYYKRQAESERRAEEAAKRKRAIELRRMKPQSMGQYFARNLGALTPLGTLSPTTLLPLAGILGSVGEAAVTASQSLALLPAAGIAAAAGIGTLIVGMRGFGDALSGMGDPKKFAEALAQLSPNAQQAALSLKNLVDGPLGDLKRATQDALFAGVSPTLQALARTFGPVMQRMTTSIATSFNQMFTGISFEMMTPEMQERVAAITSNISAMFDRIRPGISALNSAFIKLAETGSGFLPRMADGFSNLMVTFDNFITRAQEDGSLQNFMQKGIDAVAALSKWLLGFGQEIYEVFGNKSPEEFMNTLNGVKDVLVGLGKLLVVVADIINSWGPAIGSLVDALGGFENVLYALVGFGFVGWLAKIFTLFKNIKTLIGPAFVARIAALTGAFGLVGPAATTAAGAASTAFISAGPTAGKGFGSGISKSLKALPWVGLGVYVADLISSGLRDGSGGWRDAIAKGLDPNFIFNPVEWVNAAREALGFGPLTNVGGHMLPSSGPSGDKPGESIDYKATYPRGENPAGPLIPTTPSFFDDNFNFPLPNVPLDENGKALTDSEILDKYRGELPRDSYAVDPFTDPITGQKLSPMLPTGPNGLPEYPAGGVPGTPSIQGPVMPQYNSFGQLTGYGANMVDPEEVFDAELSVVDRARDLEEAKKDLLAAQQAGVLSAEEINDLERRVVDQKISHHRALVQLGKAQTGDIEKLKTETDSARDALGDFGAAIDKDFGISKGLPGIAENITKFLANLAFAPAFGAIRGAQAGLGFPQGEGVGSGLVGIAASSMGYYKGGPMDPGREQAAPSYASSGYTPSYSPSFQVGPQPAGVGYGSGPDVPGVTKGDLKGINIATIPVAAQQYANNCINAAAQIILSADGVSLTQDALENTIARGGSINSLAAGLNKLNPSGGYVAIEGSGGSPEALYSAVQDSVNKGLGAVLNVAPASAGGGKIAGRNYPAGHFIAVTGYDSNSGRINLSDTGDGSMYSVTAAEAFQSSRGRGLVAGTGVPKVQGPPSRQGPILGPPLPKYASGGEVPIMAHSGEHVLTRDDVAAMGGQRAVYNFRRSLRSYEVGGPIQPTDLGGLLGVDSPTAPPAPQPPKPPMPKPPAPPAPPKPPAAPVPPALPGPLAAEAPAIPPPAQIPETVLPGGVETPGSVIGAQVEAPAGYGEGLSITGGGLLGMAQTAAVSAAGIGGMMGGGSGAGAAAAMQTAMELMNRGIEYGAQVAGISAQGALETFLPAGGSELASNNWLTRLVGGIAGAAPAMANLAGGTNQGTLAGVGGPPTPEQIAAQGMDPNRAQHTGAGAPAGPYTGVNIQNYVVSANEDRAGQDLARYQPAPGAR